MEPEQPHKIRLYSLADHKDVYSCNPPLNPENPTPLQLSPSQSFAKVATSSNLNLEGSDDNPPAPSTRDIPIAGIDTNKASQPSGIDQQGDMVIISDDKDGDSLFGSPSPSSTHKKGETQGRVQDSTMTSVDNPEIIIISDNDDNEGSLFGNPSSDDDSDDSLFGDPASDDDISNASLKQEQPPRGVNTPDAMSCILMPHQRIGLEWLLKHENGTDKGGVLADDMGLGKTIQALALILSNPPKDPARKTTLIVAPLALLQQWPREINEKTKPGHKLRVHIFHGKGRQISVKQLLSFDVVLTNYDSLSAEFKISETKKTGMILLHPDVHFHRVILDEAHNIKNRDTFAAKGAYRLQADYRLAMTGTPLMNKPEELYSVLRFLDIPKYNEWEYFNRHITRPLQDASFGNATLSLLAMRRINDLKDRTMLVRKKTDLLDGKPIITLPGRTNVTEYCTFENDELAFYLALQNKVKIEVQRFMKASKGDRNFTNLLVKLLRLRQACCHPNLLVSREKENEQPEYLDDLDAETSAAFQDSQDTDGAGQSLDFSSMTPDEIRALLAEPKPEPKKPKKKSRTKAEKLAYYRELEEDYQPSAKIRKTLDILASIQKKAPQDKIIIFSFFTSFLDILAIGIRRAGFKFKRYDGTLNAAEKDQILREFTNPGAPTKILLTSLKTGNAGLNLNIANHIILEEPYWNPFVEQQAIDRAHRIGQTKHVHVHRLVVKDSVEMRIIAKQEQKRAMVDIALGTGDNKDLQQQRATLGALTKKDVFDLLNPNMELPEGVMRDDVRDNLELFSPTTTKVPTTSASVRNGTGATDRVVARRPSRAPAAAPARVPSRVPAKRPREVQSGLSASNSDELDYQKSVKKPRDGPTDWTGLLNKYGGQKRRRFQ